MAVNLSALSTLSTSATALSNLILVSPNANNGIQPQQKIFPDGSVTQKDPPILFNYEGENTVLLESDITDHFVEDNTATADQIALRPEIITTHGYIGELNDIPATPILLALKAAADKLTVIDAYTPQLSVTALLLYQEAFQAYQLLQLAQSAAVAAWQSVVGTGPNQIISGVEFQPNQNKQQIAFQKFYGYYRKRTLFTVQTPWAIFHNMAIKSLRAVQDEETRVITDFEVSFKIMRFANTVDTSATLKQARAAIQGASEVNTGTSSGVPSTQSFSGSITSIK